MHYIYYNRSISCMKEFFQMMRRFISPYKKYVVGAVGLNLLSAVFNVFSFSLLIPILNILFKTGESEKVYHFMEWGSGELKDVAVNNFYYYVSELIEIFGPATTLLWLGLFLAGMTLAENRMLFRFYSHHDSASYRCSTRYPHHGLFKGNVPPTQLPI